MTQSDTDRLIGFCAASMSLCTIYFAGEFQMLWNVLISGTATDRDNVFFIPFTQPYYLSLGAVGLPLAIAFLISHRRFFWFVVVWLAVYGIISLLDLIDYVYRLYQGIYGGDPSYIIPIPPGTSMLVYWAWVVIPRLFYVVPPFALLFFLLRARSRLRFHVA